jgi:hypothetical protein
VNITLGLGFQHDKMHQIASFLLLSILKAIIFFLRVLEYEEIEDIAYFVQYGKFFLYRVDFKMVIFGIDCQKRHDKLKIQCILE